nr:MAG TPA: hypothetical protein [Caudoviricetes sp.]
MFDNSLSRIIMSAVLALKINVLTNVVVVLFENLNNIISS